MANIDGNPTFQGHVRQLEPTDPKAPETWNPNYQALINNDVFLAIAICGGEIVPAAGGETVTYDGEGRVSTVSYTTWPVGTKTIVYDDGNGGRIDYVEVVLSSPAAITVRNTYSYDAEGRISGKTRTVS